MTATPPPPRVAFDQLLIRTYWNYRHHPVIVLPTMLQTALQVVAQSLFIIPALITLLALLRSGLVGRIVLALRDQRLDELFELVRSPGFLGPMVVLALVAGMILFLVSVVGGGVINAGEFGSYAVIVEGASPSTATVFLTASRLWRRLIVTTLVHWLIVWGPLSAGLALLAVSLLNLLSAGAEGFVLLLLAGLIVLLAAAATVVLALFGVYAFPAAVLEGRTGLAAYRRSFQIASRHLGVTLTYGGLRAASYAAIFGVAFLADSLGSPVSSLASVLVVLLLGPLLHLTKTWLFHHLAVSGAPVEYDAGPSVFADLQKAVRNETIPLLRRGLRELMDYAAAWRNIGFHGVAVAAFLFGIVAGTGLAQGGLADVLQEFGVGQGNPAFSGPLPVALGIDLFFHNWEVAMAVALAGIGFVAPTVLSLLFNGVVLGVLAQVIPGPAMFLSAILPHGIIELPTFLIAGSLGVKLGVFALRAALHRRIGEDARLHELARQAVWVILGLAPLFLLAGLIEALVTPEIMKLFGWRF